MCNFQAERKILRGLFDAAVSAAMPDIIIPKNLPPRPKGRTVVVGAGKASAAMAQAFERHWNGPLSGLVITRYGHAVPCQSIEIIEASHPVPDENGHQATKRILKMAQELGPDDLLVTLISGGGSALLNLPAPGLTLADKQAVNQLLLNSGMAIGDMNVVRKHISAIKGGRLATAAWPAKTVSLMISDVPGDDPGTIASGPTVGDISTLAQAREILDTLAKDLNKRVISALADQLNESPSPSDARLANTENHVIAAPMASLQAAIKMANATGVEAILMGDDLQGEARELGHKMAKRALEIRSGKSPVVLISGGETTVTLTGKTEGKGGRNVEFLMGLAEGLNAAPNVFALAGDTDGIDGAVEIAGAFVTPDTIQRAADLGYPLEHALAAHDGHGFFGRLGDQIVTGPTLTNVNDFRAVLIARDAGTEL
jgi:glycerate 2-kinase